MQASEQVLPGPLDTSDLRILSQAGARARALKPAVTLARFNGWSLLLAGALCLLAAVLEPLLLLVALVLPVLGLIELKGARLFQARDRRGPRWLAFNQLALFICVTIYCGVRIYAGLNGPSPVEEALQQAPALHDLLGDGQVEGLSDTVDQAYRVLIIAVYGAVLGACALYQGGCAFYYLTRTRALEEDLAQTPAWVRAAQQALQC